MNEYGNEVWTHTSYDDLPGRWRHLPVFCVVRNPWDWYVSWYHYQVARGPARDPDDPRAIWKSVFRSGEADFKEVVTRACSGDFDDVAAPSFRGGDRDLYSARVMDIAGPVLDRPDFTALRFEGLRKGLVRYLRAHADVSDALASAIKREPPRRTSTHDPYSHYYANELRVLVGEKTNWLCERFDYRFASRSLMAKA